MMLKLLISLFDYTGNWSLPYKENGWKVIQIDKKLGKNILTWRYKRLIFYKLLHKIGLCKIGVLIAIPCTDYALSGAKHFALKDKVGVTDTSNRLVDRTKIIIDWFNPDFWCLENPMSRIHSLHKWLGKVKHKFNPCDYAGYDLNPNNSRYNKMTWLWGKFNKPINKRIEPFEKDNPGWKKLGGKSERTKELRSITPLGFSYAFYEANR